jgi:hypothetical protein
MSNRVCVADERTEDVVIVQRPIHNTIMVVTFTSRENALVVVCELHQVYTIALAVISVDFLSTLQVVQAD